VSRFWTRRSGAIQRHRQVVTEHGGDAVQLDDRRRELTSLDAAVSEPGDADRSSDVLLAVTELKSPLVEFVAQLQHVASSTTGSNLDCSLCRGHGGESANERLPDAYPAPTPPPCPRPTLPRRVSNSRYEYDEVDAETRRWPAIPPPNERIGHQFNGRTPLRHAYVSENYRAAIVLTTAEGVPYLDKFAVLDEAQGEGLGRAVWQRMRAAHPTLFWRSRHGNPVNAFYEAEADGSIRQPAWKAFWIGLPDFMAIERCVAHAATRPPTLGDAR